MHRSFREPVNGLTHLSAAVMAAAGSIVLLLLGGQDPARELALGAYGASLILMFSTSAAYHLVRTGPRATRILRQLDHSAIYLLIAGTYTPFCILAFSGFWKWGLFSLVWSLAVIGIIVKIFYMKAPRWLTAGVYVIMGWLCIGAIGQMITVLPGWALAWLIIGGITYTAGAVVYSTRILDFRPGQFGFHEVWHIFVILGAAAHFCAIFAILVPS